MCPRWGGVPLGAAAPVHPPRSTLSPPRDRRDRHRSKSRDGSRGDKSVTIQAPGEPLLDNESTRGDERVSGARRGSASSSRREDAAEGGSRRRGAGAPGMPAAPQQSG